MAQPIWRKRGYVQDSEDETSDIEGNKSTSQISTTYLHKQADEPQDGEFHDDPAVQQDGYFVSIESVHDPTKVDSAISILSSRPNTSRSSSQLVFTVSTEIAQRQGPSSSQTDNSQVTQPQPQPWSRSLRERRPDQLHPYTVEQEKYRKTFRDRGLRPVRVESGLGAQNDPSILDDGAYASDSERASEKGSEKSSQTMACPLMLQSSSHESLGHVPGGQSPLLLPSMSPHAIPDGQSSQELSDVMDLFRRSKRPRLNSSPLPSYRTIDSTNLLPPDLHIPSTNKFSRTFYDRRKQDLVDECEFELESSSDRRSDMLQSDTSVRSMPGQSKYNDQRVSSDDEVRFIDQALPMGRPSDGIQEIVEAGRLLKGVLPRSFATLEYKRQLQQDGQALLSPERVRQVAPPNFPARGVAQTKLASSVNNAAEFYSNLFNSSSDDDQPVEPWSQTIQSSRPQNVRSKPRNDDDQIRPIGIAFRKPRSKGSKKQSSSGEISGRNRTSLKRRKRISKTRSKNYEQQNFIDDYLLNHRGLSSPNLHDSLPRTARSLHRSYHRPSHSLGDQEHTKSGRFTTIESSPSSPSQLRLNSFPPIIVVSKSKNTSRSHRRQTYSSLAQMHKQCAGQYSKGNTTRVFRVQPVSNTSQVSLVQNTTRLSGSAVLSFNFAQIERRSNPVDKFTYSRRIPPRPLLRHAQLENSEFAAGENQSLRFNLDRSQLNHVFFQPQQASGDIYTNTSNTARDTLVSRKTSKLMETKAGHSTSFRANHLSASMPSDGMDHANRVRRHPSQEFFSETRESLLISQEIPRKRHGAQDQSRVNGLSPYLAVSHGQSLSGTLGIESQLDTTGIQPAILLPSGITDICCPSTYLTFGIIRIKEPVSFHPSTLLHAGQLHNLMSMGSRDLHADIGHHVLDLYGDEYVWSDWNMKMAQQYQVIFDRIKDCITPEFDNTSSQHIFTGTFLLKNVAEANAKWLWFRSLAEKNAFATVTTSYLIMITDISSRQFQELLRRAQSSTKLIKAYLNLSVQCLIMLVQLQVIVKDVGLDIERMAMRISELCLRAILGHGMLDIRDRILEIRQNSNSQMDKQQELVFLESAVILKRVAQKQMKASDFLDTINTCLRSTLETTLDITNMERVWKDFFTMLAVLDLQKTDSVTHNQQYFECPAIWTIPKLLTSTLFDLYRNLRPKASHLNFHIKLVLKRIVKLITEWELSDCTSIAGPCFDFFTKNRLMPLYGETIDGSKTVHDRLAAISLLRYEEIVGSFDLLLVLLTVALHALRNHADQKAGRSLVWRCLPNHGRLHSKDADLLHEDQMGLQNHHVLLCTLFRAAPAECKSRIIQNFQDLVDHGRSHQAICRINIEAFSALLEHQLGQLSSTAITRFAFWLKEMTYHAVGQYRLARTAIESELCMAPRQKEPFQSYSLAEAQQAINENQSEVMLTLKEIVSALCVVVTSAQCQSQIVEFLRIAEPGTLFTLIDEDTLEMSRVMTNCLMAYKFFLDLPERSTSQNSIEDFSTSPGAPIRLDFMQSQIFELLSSMLLLKQITYRGLIVQIVVVWARIIYKMVGRPNFQWATYLDIYGDFSWARLPETESKRALAPLFFAHILEQVPSLEERYKEAVIESWLISLVEPEGTLEHQHLLTTAILNVLDNHPITSNLPFSSNSQATYHMTPDTFRSRRLMIISTVLSNINRHLELLKSEGSSKLTSFRQEVTKNLEILMSCMKRNYKALDCDNDAQSTYAEFVHHVIEELQQYKFNTCQIDSFFTDSIDFPVPIKDPDYVAGRIMSYCYSLHDTGTATQFVTFFKSFLDKSLLKNSSERAKYCIEKVLFDSTENVRFTFRAAFLEALLPVYLENAWTTPAGWIQAMLLVEIGVNVMSNTRIDLGTAELPRLQSNIVQMTTLLTVISQQTESLMQQLTQPINPTSMKLVRLMLDLVSHMIIPLELISRSASLGTLFLHDVYWLRDFSIWYAQSALGLKPDVLLKTYKHHAYTLSAFGNLREICSRELKGNMTSDWVNRGSNYFIMGKGGAPTEKFAASAFYSVEQKLLLSAIERFHNVLVQSQIYNTR